MGKMDAIAKLKAVGLTDGEISVLSRLYEGKVAATVAVEMGCSRQTVVNYKCSALKKLKLAGLNLPEFKQGPAFILEYRDPRWMDQVLSQDDKYEELMRGE